VRQRAWESALPQVDERSIIARNSLTIGSTGKQSVGECGDRCAQALDGVVLKGEHHHA
jgi:hypothetical protein